MQDFTRLKSLNREDQQMQPPAAKTMTAMYVARRLYGCSLGEEKELVYSFRENEVPHSPLDSVHWQVVRQVVKHGSNLGPTTSE